MKCTGNLTGLLSVLLVGTAAMAQVPASEIDTHIATAKAAAREDYRGTFVNLCLPGAAPGGRGAATRGGADAAPRGGGGAAARGGADAAARGGGGAAARGGADAAARGGAGTAARGAGASTSPDRANWYASPYKVFDNFYWLGTRQHSSWALRTSAGLIIIDTNFAWATEPKSSTVLLN
jgi:hypothetical protein